MSSIGERLYQLFKKDDAEIKQREKQREEDMATLGNPGHSPHLIASQLAQLQYQQALMQAQSYQQSANQPLSTANAGVFGANFNPNTAAGTGNLTGTGTISGAAVYFPNPTSIHTNIAFTDATGRTNVLLVDQAYASILTHISNVHATNQSQPRNVPPMPDGDFTEDEMSAAEEIIKEMSNGKSWKSETHP